MAELKEPVLVMTICAHEPKSETNLYGKRCSMTLMLIKDLDSMIPEDVSLGDDEILPRTSNVNKDGKKISYASMAGVQPCLAGAGFILENGLRDCYSIAFRDPDTDEKLELFDESRPHTRLFI